MDRSIATWEKPLLNQVEYVSEFADDDWDLDIADTVKIADKLRQRTHMSSEKFYQIYKDTMRHFSQVERLAYRQYQTGEKKPEEFFRECQTYLLNHHTVEMQDALDFKVMLERIKVSVFGFDVLQPLIDDNDVSDIKVCDIDDIRVRMGGKAYNSDAYFVNEDDLIRFISSLALRHDYDILEQPQTTFTDTHDDNYILRFVISSEVINAVNHPYLHIRKIPKVKVGFEVLKQRGMLNDNLERYVKDRARLSHGLFIAGPPGSGKTTLYNEMLEFLPTRDREPVVIQENDELHTKRPGFIFHHVVHGFGGHVRVTLRDLTQMALVEGVNQICIGESKGAEMRDIASILNTGGYIMTSLHSNSAEDTLDRAIDMIMQSEDIKDRDSAKRLLKGLDTIIYMSDYSIQEIVEVEWDKEKKDFKFIPIYRKGL